MADSITLDTVLEIRPRGVNRNLLDRVVNRGMPSGVYSATREHVSVHTRGLVQPGIAIKWVAKIGSRSLSSHPSLAPRLLGRFCC